jgi:GlcNAc-P-P-Und epimerase
MLQDHPPVHNDKFLHSNRELTAIIFGGTGFIGRHLAATLVARGCRDVAVADIRPPAYPLPRNVRFVRCDVREPIRFAPRGRHPLIFNLAAVHRTPGHPDHEYFDTNVTGARNVSAFAARTTTRLWFASSIAVYGLAEAAKDEASPTEPNSAYGRSKLEAEAIHREWAHAGDGRTLVVVRPGTVFGPGEGGNFTRLAAALRGHRFFYAGRRDTIKACGYVCDLVETLFFCEPFADPIVTYNFTYAPPPSIRDICDALCDAGAFMRPRVAVPARVLVGAARAAQAVGSDTLHPDRVLKLVRSTNIVPALLQEHGYTPRFDLCAALADWRDSDPPGEFV